MWITTLQSLNHYLTLGIIFPLIFFVGLYLTIRLRGIQFTKLKVGLSHLFKKDTDSEGNISNFEAVSAVLAGNLGTGNISGMAVAITLGGPGALVWMWVMAFLGAIIKFAGCFLGLKYREKTESGEYVGGPMYYLSRGLKAKKMAIFFSISALLTSVTVGNLVQVNSIFLPLKKIGIPPHSLVITLLVLSSIVIMGGLKRIAKLMGTLVPIMTFLYLMTAFIIIGMHVKELPSAFHVIFVSAFSPAALLGGSLGYGITRAITSGFERGIFATDAGCGIAPILQSGAKCSKPLLEGIVGMIAPFIVMTICTVTALVLIVTQAWTISGEKSTNMCTWAFQNGLHHPAGSYIVILSLVLFAFTTIITWAYCGEKAVEFLFSKKATRKFKYFFIAMIPVGAYCHIDLVWILADLSIGMMLISNLFGVIGLSSQVIEETNKGFKELEI